MYHKHPQHLLAGELLKLKDGRYPYFLLRSMQLLTSYYFVILFSNSSIYWSVIVSQLYSFNILCFALPANSRCPFRSDNAFSNTPVREATLDFSNVNASSFTR